MPPPLSTHSSSSLIPRANGYFLAKSVNEKTFEKLIGYPRNVISSVGEREDTCWKNFFYGVKEYRDRFDLKDSKILLKKKVGTDLRKEESD